MRKTSNYGLVLYDPDDKMIITASKDSLNHTMELIDEALGGKATLTDVIKYIDDNKDTLKGEDGYSPTIEVSKEDKVTTITITDINGTKTAVINDGAEGSGGGGGRNVLLGETPLTLEEAVSSLQLVGDGEISYSLNSPTVADFEYASIATPMNATLTQLNDGTYRLTANDSATLWYSPYVDITFDGLTVNENYVVICSGPRSAGSFVEDATTNGAFLLYDSAGNQIISATGFENPLSTVPFTAPTPTVKMRLYPAGNYYFTRGCKTAEFNSIYINKANITTNRTAIVNKTGTFTDSALIPGMEAGITITSTPACYVYAVSSSGGSGAKSRHADKICVCFGDSITGNMATPNDYPSVLATETDMKVYNGGFGGCRMSYHPTTAYDAFCMYQLANSIAEGSWTLQDNQVGNVSDYIHADIQLANLKAVDWNKVDFITIAYGTNDIAANVPLDNSSNTKDTTTILGSLRYSIETILSVYPQIKILLLTPIYRYWNEEGKVEDSNEKTFAAGTFKDVVDGIISVGEEYGIPVVDMYRTLGFNKITRNHYFPSNDGTHPNVAGLRVIGGKIAGKLLSEY